MLSDTDTFAFTAIAANLGKMRSSLTETLAFDLLWTLLRT